MAKFIRVLSSELIWDDYILRKEEWVDERRIEFVALNEVSDDAAAAEFVDGMNELFAKNLNEPYIIEALYTPDGYYIGDKNHAKRLIVDRAITPHQFNNAVVPFSHVPCSIGFCEKEQKWYGWSHRGIGGFGVGSTVKLGDIAFKPSNLEETVAKAMSFWSDPGHLNMAYTLVPYPDGTPDLIVISWTYASDEKLIPNTKLHGQTTSVTWVVRDFGRGEWTAETLEDAKQMAIDYASNIA